MKLLLLFVALLPASAESLHYVINWPSALALGEVTLSSNLSYQQAGGTYAGPLGLDIDASIPGFVIHDHYSSTVSGNLCSIEIDKKYEHGARKDDETIAIDQTNHTAVRTGRGGGPGPSFTVEKCARDPLAFLQFVRSELAQGRVPASQAVVFGSVYNVSLTDTGMEQIKSGAKTVSAEHILAAIKGPATNITVEVLFSQDAARTPLLVRIPLPLGTFTVELAP